MPMAYADMLEPEAIKCEQNYMVLLCPKLNKDQMKFVQDVNNLPRFKSKLGKNPKS
jgi:hypothetical protein